MAIPVARVHLKMAHAALPALLPTPPRWKMLPVFPIPTPCVAVILPKQIAKPGRGRANNDERWDARKTKSASATSPPPKPGRADSAERWDAHKKAAIPASSSSSSGTSSLATSSSKKWPISRASSAERWDVHKKSCLPQAELLDDGENSSVGSNDIDAEEEEEIVWKPRAMYARPGFVVAAPQASMIPMPTSFLVPVA